MTIKFKNSETKWIEFLKEYSGVIIVIVILLIFAGYWGFFVK